MYKHKTHVVTVRILGHDVRRYYVPLNADGSQPTREQITEHAARAARRSARRHDRSLVTWSCRSCVHTAYVEAAPPYPLPRRPSCDLRPQCVNLKQFPFKRTLCPEYELHPAADIRPLGAPMFNADIIDATRIVLIDAIGIPRELITGRPEHEQEAGNHLVGHDGAGVFISESQAAEPQG